MARPANGLLPATGTAAGTTPRAEAQRERILCAAQQCFIEQGFHAASMARIAETAQMSAGLIYRYFANKNAIVLAIIERQLNDTRRKIRQLHSAADISARLLEIFERWRAPDSEAMNAALYMEMSAEGTRDPQVAEALRSSDRATRAELEAWLCRTPEEGGAGLSAELAASRALQLQCVVGGLVLRAVREPDLDRAPLQRAIDEILGQILAP
jgi:AcrR family transcriptional regulator